MKTFKKSDVQKLGSMIMYKKCANMKEFRRNMKDELKLLLYLTLYPMKFKPIFLYIIYVACQFSFALCLTTYRLLSTFDKNLLLKHGSFGGIEIFVLINLWTVLFKFRKMTWFINLLNDIFIPIDEDILGKQKYKNIMYNIKFVKIISVLNYSLAIGAAFGFTLSPEYFNTRTYLAIWIRENFENHSEYLLFFIHMSNFPVALVLVSLCIVMTYSGTRAIFQLIVINKGIEGICDSHIHPNRRYNSKIYQAMVRQKLKMCVMMHEICIRISLIGAEIIYVPIVLFSVGGVILGGSLLLEFFTNDPTEMSNQYFGIICFSLAGLISATLYVSSGQLLKDESEKTYNLLVHLPWYYMNKENKQIYSIFLQRAATPISMTNNLIEINFLLLVRRIFELICKKEIIVRL
ncbi:hypothetical protein WA026_017334 [Henosepilachna vigintioctopunctata]|uniref:Odorant receptor n=1 Tax=Henosepilachna vigintioctopunctata TaxID=420089 RepID=A0AAW1UPC9_9CUCU